MNKNFVRVVKIVALCSLAVVVAGSAVYAGSEDGRKTVSSMWSGNSGCPMINVAATLGLRPSGQAEAASKEGGCSSGREARAVSFGLCNAPRATAATADYATCGAPKAEAVSADYASCGAPNAVASSADYATCGAPKAELSAAAYSQCPFLAALASKDGCKDKADCGDKVYPVTGASGACTAVKTSDLVAEAAKDPSLSTFVQVAYTAGLTELLQKESPITVFVPTNEAFEQIDRAQMDALLADSTALRKVLMRHVVADSVCGEKARKADAVAAVSGSDIRLVALEGCDTLTVNGAKVLKSDVIASNGTLHVIDRVLLDEADRLDVAALSD